MLRVDSEPEFLRALEQEWDAIISDYNLPGFSGLVALDLLKASGSGVPFLLLSGEIGEDAAVEAMRNGASDYLLKNNMARLVPALLHAVEANETRRARLLADRELGESKQRLRELAQHLQTSVESERAAIAREIHDDVGGSLTALNFDLAWIARHAESPAVRQRAASALETVAHAIEASQRVMHNLRPAILEQGLVAALQWMSSRFERRTGIACQFSSDQEALDLPAGRAAGGLPHGAGGADQRLQACAGDARRRSNSPSPPGTLTLEISDNGRGLDRDDLAKARSFGIRGLHERASTVGGWVDLSSSARGTTLILSVPLPADRGRRAERAESPTARAGATALHDPSDWGTLVIRVLLCDDHALIRRGIRDTLSDAPDIEVVGEAGDYGELRALLRGTACDVLVLDINLPGRSGLDVLHVLKDEGSALRVLVVSMYPEDQYAIRALRAGAFGYVNKGGDPALIVAAVRTVAQGRKYVTPEIAQMLVESLTTPVSAQAHEKLSDRELQTLVMIASGKRLSDIAEELSLSPKTVSVYRARVLREARPDEQLRDDGLRDPQRAGGRLSGSVAARRVTPNIISAHDRRQPSPRCSTARRRPSSSTAACWRRHGAPTCRCSSGCATSASSRRTWTSSSRCAWPTTSRPRASPAPASSTATSSRWRARRTR